MEGKIERMTSIRILTPSWETDYSPGDHNARSELREQLPQAVQALR